MWIAADFFCGVYKVAGARHWPKDGRCNKLNLASATHLRRYFPRLSASALYL